MSCSWSPRNLFRSTPPHGGRRRLSVRRRRRQAVSIHALAPGGDRRALPEISGVPVSIYTPRAGRPRISTSTPCCASFDPRARGDDTYSFPCSRRSGCFDPRRPRGGQPSHWSRWSGCRRFDPRPCTGGDIDHMGDQREVLVSIHAPRMGGDIARSPIKLQWGVSIHAPRGGRRQRRCHLHDGLVVSIHAPAMGATKPGISMAHVVLSFDPRPRDGGDASAIV